MGEVSVATQAALQAALDSASEAVTIKLTGDIKLDGNELSLKNPVNITLTITGNPFTIDADGKSRVLKLNNGTVTLSNINLTGGNTISRGGGVYVIIGTALVVNSGTQIYNNFARNGGGIFNEKELVINDCDIHDNVASDGAGVSNYSGNMTMHWGSIYSNRAEGSGGGIAVINGDATISGYIANNEAGLDGGGIQFGPNASSVEVRESEIVGNTAGRNGGGINVAYPQLKNLVIYDDVVFSGNRASKYYFPLPQDEGTYEASVDTGTQWTQPFTTGYNNYDIAYTQWNDFGLEATKTADTASSIPDGTVLFTVRIENPADEDALNLGLYDLLHEGLTLEPGSVTVDGSPVADNTLTGGSEILASLSAGGNATVNYRVRLDTGLQPGEKVSNMAVFACKDGDGELYRTEASTDLTVAVTAQLFARKTGINGSLEDKQFPFGLFKAGGNTEALR